MQRLSLSQLNQITPPSSYHHKSLEASTLPSPPHTRNHRSELSQLVPPQPQKHSSSRATAPIFPIGLFFSFFTNLKVFYTFELFYTFDLLVIGWYFASLRSISTCGDWWLGVCFFFFGVWVFVSSCEGFVIAGICEWIGVFLLHPSWLHHRHHHRLLSAYQWRQP